ncbi:PRELI domain-containing protein 1 mitochondrial [Biomphalaria pfeifferi]|uniref:PRELI domain-containing protein 1 mitochondrial n=1 Tax=Biomphalaria pfeifferi TaxID=112525 RepID=A0AAD8BIF2_BIOPF|nr:PRELI domain-containing protein 1 mitochondrial [Biomphalaria pfeifferi]
MVKFVATTSLFKYTWEQVAISFWQRYPNPNSKHVLTEDVISRQIDGDKIISKRMLTKTNKIPKWGEKLVGQNKNVLIVEESVVDMSQKTVTTYTRNLGLQKIMSIEEKCVYKINPENPAWTICERTAFVSSCVFGVAGALEVFGAKRFQSNAKKATQGLDFVLTSLFRSDHLKDHPLLVSTKIKDTARKAAEMAKSKAPPILSRASST